MSLPLRTHQPIIFAGDLDAATFEDLCCDLLEAAEGARQAERYARSGQTQMGVDILARRQDGRMIAGSCKNYEKFTESDLRSATAEFWPHRDQWKDRGIDRFILFIGCSKQSKKLQDEIIRQEELFMGHGLDLGVWDNRDLTNLLRNRRDIGIKYFAAHVQTFLYGEVSETFSLVSSTAPRMAQASLVAEVSDQIEAELPKLRGKARSGRWEEALREVEALMLSVRWTVLDASLRSKALGLAAALNLDARDDRTKAKEYIRLARDLDPHGKFQVVEGVILLREQGIRDALDFLAEPESTDAWNIKMSLLVDLKKGAEVLSQIEDPCFQPNSGSYRVASLAATVEGNFEAARAYCEKAMLEEPEGFHLRQQSASLRYLEAVLPTFREVRFLEWPIPPEWEFVLSDDASIQALQDAEITFAALIQILSEEDSRRTSLEGWRLACLANHPLRQGLAASYAAEVIRRDPCHIPALVWSLERGFPFDWEASMSALGEAIEAGASRELVHALSHLHISSGNSEAAANLLDRYRHLYDDALEVWAHLRVQLAVAAEDDELCARLVADITDPLVKAQLRFAMARVGASKHVDHQLFIDAALEAYRETGEPRYLFEASEAGLLAGDPAVATEKADELMALLPSPATFRVVAHALLESGLYARMLALFTEHEGLIPSGMPGRSLRHLRVECHRRRGDLLSAAKLAGDLAHGEGDVGAHFALFKAQVQGADVRGSIGTARELLRHPDISGMHLLSLAKEIRLLDEGLATLALEKAIEKGLPEQALTEVVAIGLRLGLDDLVDPLFRRLAETAGQENSFLKPLSLDEIRDAQREHLQRAEEFISAYRRGDIPLHLGESVLGQGLFRLLLFRDASGVDYNAGGTLVRSGVHCSRTIELKGTEVYMDSTALIVADQLGLFPLLEREFGRIWISSHSLTLMRGVADAIAPIPPKLREDLRMVVSLIEDAKIHPATIHGTPQGKGCSSSAVLAGDSCEWLCTLTPSREVSSPPRKEAPGQREISADELSALGKKGDHGRSNRKGVPNPRHSIYLQTGVALKLAADGTLSSLANEFFLFVGVEEKISLERTLAEADLAFSQSQRLLEIADSLALKVGRGLYNLVLRDDDGGHFGDDSPGAALEILRDMGLAAKQGVRFVWCDDRYISSFSNFETAQIIGVSEVLRGLRDGGKLSRSDFFGALGKLRAANFRYLPLTAEEIIWCISKGSCRNGRFREGPELAILRRALSSCILDVPYLRKPTPDASGGNKMEFQWIFDSFQSVADAIVSLWEDDSLGEEERRSTFDYLISRFFWPALATLEMSGVPQSSEDKAVGQATALAVLMAKGFCLESLQTERPELRQHKRARFYDWISLRMLKPLSYSAPEVLDALAAVEADSLCKHPRGKQSRSKVWRAVVARAVNDLPELVKARLDFDVGFRNWLGASEGGWQISVGGVVFNLRDFWRGVAQVGSPQGGMATSSDGQEVRFSRLPDWPPWKKVGIVGVGFPERGRFTNDALPIVLLRREDLRRSLSKRVDWLDVPLKERLAVARRLSSERDPGQRVEKFLEQRRSSLEWLYVLARRRLRKREDLTTEDLIPESLESLANHLRISRAELEGGEFDLEGCAARLVSDIGLARAAERLIHLPVPLPKAIVAGCASAADGTLREIVSRLTRTVRHPLALIQLANLLEEASSVVPSLRDVARRCLERSLRTKEGVDTWNFYEKVLSWTFAVLGSAARFQAASPAARLLFSWLHAGRLADLFLRSNVAMEKGAEVFASQARAFGIDLGAWEPALWDDCMHPRFAQRCPVLLNALASFVEGVPQEARSSFQQDAIFGTGKNGNIDRSIGFMLRDRSLMRNSLSSFLGGESSPDYRYALTPELCETIHAVDPHDLVTGLLNEVEEAPREAVGWPLLELAVGDLPLPEELERRLKALLVSSEIRESSLSKSSLAASLQRFAATRWRYLEEPGDRELIEEGIFQSLRSVSSNSNVSALKEEVAHFASCFVGICIVPGNQIATYERFYGLLARMLREWPACAKEFNSPLWCWPSAWPISRQAGYWTFEMTRRAIIP